jgi:Recombination endonuclease VII
MKKITTPPNCHPDRLYYAKDLCKQCYTKPFNESWRNRNLEYHRSLCRRWVKNNKTRTRDNELRREFGLTPEQYDIILAQQGGHCKFCDRIPTGYKNLPVEHNHVTGEIRGILCQWHNITVTHLESERARLDEFITYLDTSVGVSLPTTSRYLPRA